MDKYEVYYTDFLIKEYIREGEDLLKRGVKGTLFIFAIFAVLMALFLIFGWMLSFGFALIAFGTLIYAACGLPLSRFKLYK